MRRPFSAVLLLAAAAASILMLAAPFLIPSGAAVGLDGAANWMDHVDRWQAFPPLPSLAYRIGDLVCHQMESRSLHANGNQFPVDARLLTALVASNVGLLAVRRLPDLPRAGDAAAALVPASLADRVRTRAQRRWLVAAMAAAAVAPTLIDGGLQLLTLYESTNPMRIVTGALLGGVGAMVLALGLDAIARPLPAAAQPSGARHG
jgi:uncharacterized membrane protein